MFPRGAMRVSGGGGNSHKELITCACPALAIVTLDAVNKFSATKTRKYHLSTNAKSENNFRFTIETLVISLPQNVILQRLRLFCFALRFSASIVFTFTIIETVIKNKKVENSGNRSTTER